METTKTMIIDFTANLGKETHEVIENETLSGRVFESVEISGSLLSDCTFENVTFKGCAFFGSKIANCKFINCTFENCDFQFGKIENNEFYGTQFISSKWNCMQTKGNLFNNCHLDHKSLYFLGRREQAMENCFSAFEASDLIYISDDYEQIAA